MQAYRQTYTLTVDYNKIVLYVSIGVAVAARKERVVGGGQHTVPLLRVDAQDARGSSPVRCVLLCGRRRRRRGQICRGGPHDGDRDAQANRERGASMSRPCFYHELVLCP